MLLTYKTYLSAMNRNKLRGELAPHKPTLMLAITDWIEEKMLTKEGREELKEPIPFRPELQAKFNHRWTLHVHTEVFQPSYINPIIHMQYEPFYRLVPHPDKHYNGIQSFMALESAFRGIQLNTELMQLIMQKDTREELRKLLIAMI